MKAKNKALLYNFLGFAIFFLIIRLVLGYFAADLNRILLAVIPAALATILAPKFGVVKTQSKEKVMMKWLFMKGVKEV